MTNDKTEDRFNNMNKVQSTSTFKNFDMMVNIHTLFLTNRQYEKTEH